MKRRYFALIIISLIIFVAIFFVIKLTSRNNKLGYISDDSRQVTLLKDLYSQTFNDILSENDNIKPDNTVFTNFITFKHYVISQENSLNEFFKTYFNENSKNVYTISNDFDLKDQVLSVTIKDSSGNVVSFNRYKLKPNKKEQKIDYKIISNK